MSEHHENTEDLHGFDEHGGSIHHDHSHDLKNTPYARLWWAFAINLVFLVVEVIGGLMVNSLALLADAGHMLTDVGALALAIFVAHLARRPATPNRTFGLLRAEVLGAFLNGAALVLIVGFILYEAWKRFGSSQAIDGPIMILIAVFGLIANIVSAVILAKGHEENVNLRGAFLHMIADALGSVGAIIAGLVIMTTGWVPIDVIASVVIGLLILWSSWGFLRQTMNILLEATPEDIDYTEVKESLEAMEYIDAVHDLHIWTITSGMPVLTAHIRLATCCNDTNQWQKCLSAASSLIRDKFGIEHTTLQIEPNNDTCSQECQLSK
ncbi:MAG: cation transporter [Deltaproteobacteria bacterium]|nr:cation transporter [Deltaproteobacteria bacterium]